MPEVIPAYLSVTDAAIYSSVSERHLWKLIDAGLIDTVWIGRRRLVPRDKFDQAIREGRLKSNDGEPNGEAAA